MENEAEEEGWRINQSTGSQHWFWQWPLSHRAQGRQNCNLSSQFIGHNSADVAISLLLMQRRLIAHRNWFFLFKLIREKKHIARQKTDKGEKWPERNHRCYVVGGTHFSTCSNSATGRVHRVTFSSSFFFLARFVSCELWDFKLIRHFSPLFQTAGGGGGGS